MKDLFFKQVGFVILMMFAVIFHSCTEESMEEQQTYDRQTTRFRVRDEGREVVEGKVVKLADGDSFTLLTPEYEQVRVRLLGIDAPERGQPFSKRSERFLAGLIFGKYVKVYYDQTDRYHRILGDVYVDTIWVNAEMIRNGMAWQYKYSRDKVLEKLERMARKKQAGLWQDHGAINPWEWRKKRKNGRMEQNLINDF